MKYPRSTASSCRDIGLFIPSDYMKYPRSTASSCRDIGLFIPSDFMKYPRSTASSCRDIGLENQSLRQRLNPLNIPCNILLEINDKMIEISHRFCIPNILFVI